MKNIGIVLLVLAAIGCRPDDQKTSTLDAEGAKQTRADISPALAMHLDSGNAAFRRKDYVKAREHYDAAIKADDKQPAGWFGIYMVELALGNAEAAGKALDKAQGMVPGATLIHPKPGDTAGLPSGHPSTGPAAPRP